MSIFPEIATGIVTQLPYGTARKCNVSRVDQEAGQRYAYYYDANSLASWELNFSALTGDELAALRTFWQDVGGAWDSFTFTDPDTSVEYTKCRFDGATFDVGYVGPNQYALRLVIVEFR